jgi:hypothetical protein
MRRDEIVALMQNERPGFLRLNQKGSVSLQLQRLSDIISVEKQRRRIRL